MNSRPQWSNALLIVLMVGVALAACTRSASSNNVPTVTANVSAGGGGQVPQQDATMAALGTSIRMTQTAQALVGSGGGGEVTGTPSTPTGGTSAPGATSVPSTVVPATPIPATPIPGTAAPAGTCPNPYTVKKGDWIYKIARDCKVDPQAIIAANPGIDPNKIYEGQKLNMPTGGATSAATQAKCTGTHTVVKGENLFRIAYNCGLTTEQMAAANGIKYPYTIYPGQVLKFP